MGPSEPDSFVVFAYGSNMLTRRLQARCPSAQALGMAELRGYELRWHKRSKDGSGKCDVVKVEDAEAVVYGVLFAIARSEKGKLDRAEGLRKGYDEQQIEVSQSGAMIPAQGYVATDTAAGLKPRTCYHGLVVAGAEEHSLPEDYVDVMRKVAAVENPKCEYHEANMKLIAGR
jgi:gamma-glutamylcyclotransferase